MQYSISKQLKKLVCTVLIIHSLLEHRTHWNRQMTQKGEHK